MTTVTHAGRTYRIPFADLFRPFTADEAEGMRDSIREHGIIAEVVVYDSPTFGPDCVIDGYNRLVIGDSVGAVARFRKEVGITDSQARVMAVAANLFRRHLTPQEQQAKRKARLERVAAARAAGRSVRSIAESEGVSKAQIERDVSEIPSGVPPGTPENEKVQGRDGKQYPSKPKPTPQTTSEKPSPPPPVTNPAHAPTVPKEHKEEGEFKPKEFIAGVLGHTPRPLDDKLEQIEKYRRDFTDLRTHLRRARALLYQLLEHPVAGKYLRDMEPSDRPGLMWSWTTPVIRGDKREGGWRSADLDRVISAVAQGRVDRICAGCKGGGCVACKGVGFVPPDPSAFAAGTPDLDFGEAG